MKRRQSMTVTLLAAHVLASVQLPGEQQQHALEAPPKLERPNRIRKSSRFPSYDDPVAAGAAVGGSLTTASIQGACTVHLYTHASLHHYAQVEKAWYEPPKLCAAPWSSVQLEVVGHVRGVQFDRFGALWLGSVELLRTTTPEPTALGITWRVARDLTSYSAAFHLPANASLSIPNEVDDEYTGALNMSVSLIFVSANADASSAAAALASKPSTPARSLGEEAADVAHTDPPADVVHALVDPFGQPGKSPWQVLAVYGNQTITGKVTIPHRNAIRATLDVYASAHECEEFW